tara:strand:+ start:53328 stop:53528 length:201 start_codon:yes stop_codon:yes gene_type:complete
MVIILTLIAIFFSFYVPYYLRKNKNLKPAKNRFEEFVDNDTGYPWSLNSKRRKSFYKAVQKKLSTK